MIDGRDPVATLAPMTLGQTVSLSPGVHGARARIELDPQGSRAGAPCVRLSLQGWIDRAALQRLQAALEPLGRGIVRRLVLDCARVRHIEYDVLPGLVDALADVAPPSAELSVTGLSPHVRDLFRLAGFAWGHPVTRPGLGVDGTLPIGPRREWAT
jgi:anti-anti-sigma regulatory factor